jgi:hypothetical protein
VVVVSNNDAASALQARAAVVGRPSRQRILPPSSIQSPSNFFHNKNNNHNNNNNNNNNASVVHRRGPNNKLAGFLTKLDASVAFDDELYSSRGDGGRASSLIAAATSAVAASSRMIRWPLLGALLLLALRQAHPIVVPLLKSLIQSYDRSMMARPLITKVMTGAVLATLGDALAQSKTARSSTATASTAAVRYDPRRAASFAAFDSCYRCFQHYAFPTVIKTCQGNFWAASFPCLLQQQHQQQQQYQRSVPKACTCWPWPNEPWSISWLLSRCCTTPCFSSLRALCKVSTCSKRWNEPKIISFRAGSAIFCFGSPSKR